MKPLIFLLCVLLPSFGMAQVKIHNRLLVYENFEHNKPLLHKQMHSLPDVGPYFKHNRFQILKDKYKNAYKVYDTLFNYFYELDMINGWVDTDSNYYQNKQKFIKLSKQDRSIYYLGKIKLSTKYDSYLMLNTCLVKTEDVNMFLVARKLYLVNVVNESIQSITKIASYFSAEGHEMETYTILDKKQKFVIFENELSSDVIILGRKHPEPPRKSTFHFDERGYVKIP